MSKRIVAFCFLLFLALAQPAWFGGALPALAEVVVDTAWVRLYNGPGNDDDYAEAMTIDGSGNVCVTGISEEDYVTIKYYPDGDTAWVRRYSGPGVANWATAIAVDDSDNVYVTGVSWGDGTNRDYATIKYYPDGDTAWVRRYNGPASQRDEACAVALDYSGNVYIAGSSQGNGTDWDYATIKYDQNGNELWAKRYNGPGNSIDEALALAVDSSGNAYVTGHHATVGSYPDYFDCATIKYYPNGDTAWVRTYNGPGNGYDLGSAIAVDDSGYVYVTGDGVGSGTADDYATMKYDSSGNELWVQRYDGPASAPDWPRSITVDDSGNVYVTGTSYGTATRSDYATIKYDPNGNELWVNRYDGPGSHHDGATAIAVDDFGNVYVTGYSEDGWTYDDYLTIKHYPNGDTVWSRRYDGPGHYYDEACNIGVDGAGHVYVTGWIWGGEYSGAHDYATIKYSEALRGDVNRDGAIDVADILHLTNYLFIGGPAPEPLESGNINCDGVVDIADVIYLINYLFLGGSPPCEP